MKFQKIIKINLDIVNGVNLQARKNLVKFTLLAKCNLSKCNLNVFTILYFVVCMHINIYNHYNILWIKKEP
jgi:hypothetical protein